MSMDIRLEAAGLGDYFQDGSNGYFWPTAHNEDTSHGWVTRVDDPDEWEREHEAYTDSEPGEGPKVTARYENDDVAVSALLQELVHQLGKSEDTFELMCHVRVGWAVPVGCLNPYPYIDIDDSYFIGKDVLS